MYVKCEEQLTTTRARQSSLHSIQASKMVGLMEALESDITISQLNIVPLNTGLSNSGKPISSLTNHML